MKLGRLFEYLKTLAKVKRNFVTELADETTNAVEKARLEGKAEALDDFIKDVESAQLSTEDANKEVPTEVAQAIEVAKKTMEEQIRMH